MPVQRFQTSFALASSSSHPHPSTNSSSISHSTPHPTTLHSTTRHSNSPRRLTKAPSSNSNLSFSTAISSVSSRVAKLFKPRSSSSKGSLSSGAGSAMSIATPPPSQSPPALSQPLPAVTVKQEPVQPVASSSRLVPAPAPAPRSAMRGASQRPRTRTVARRHVHYKSEEQLTSILPPSPRRSRSPVLAEVSLSLWGPPSPPLSPCQSQVPRVIHAQPVAGSSTNTNTATQGPSSASSSSSSSRPIRPKPRRPHPTRTRAHLHLDTSPSSSTPSQETSAWDGGRLHGLAPSCSRALSARRAQAELLASSNVLRPTIGLRRLKREERPVEIVKRSLASSPRSSSGPASRPAPRSNKARVQRTSNKLESCSDEDWDVPQSVKIAAHHPSLSLPSGTSSTQRNVLFDRDANRRPAKRSEREMENERPVKRSKFALSDEASKSSFTSSMSMSMTPESLYPTPENSQAQDGSDGEIEILLAPTTTTSVAGSKRRRSPSIEELEFDCAASEPAMSTTPSLASLGSMNLASPAPPSKRVRLAVPSMQMPKVVETPARSASARALRRTGTSCSGSIVGMSTRSRSVAPRVLRMG